MLRIAKWRCSREQKGRSHDSKYLRGTIMLLQENLTDGGSFKLSSRVLARESQTSMRGTTIHGTIDASQRSRELLASALISVLIAVALKTILDWIYVVYVFPHFQADFGCEFQGWPRLLETYLAGALLGGGLGITLWLHPRASGIVLILQYAVVVMPLLSLYTYGQVGTVFTYLVLASSALPVFVTHFIPRFSVPSAGKSIRAIGVILLGGMTAYVYGVLVGSGAIKWLSFDLANVYSTREMWTSLSWPLLGYLVPWQGNAINPALLALGLHRRSRKTIGIALLLQLFLFGMTGQKSFLFAIVLVVGVYAIYRYRSPLPLILLGACAVVVFSYAVYEVSGSHMIPSTFIRRLFFVPARNHAIYYDFFSDPMHPKIFLSNSFLAPLIDYPYEMTVTRVIAWAYWGKDFSPNVGYLGDAYAQFGGPGMLLFSAILALVLRMIDSLRRSGEIRLAAAIIAMPGMALVNSALFTTLSTHGFLLAMLLVWIFTSAVSKGKNQQHDLSEVPR